MRSLAQFIVTYVSRNSRWNSPKFLIGESYGTFRSVALGNYLQTTDGMYINGIVLISSVIDVELAGVCHGRRPFLHVLCSHVRSDGLVLQADEKSAGRRSGRCLSISAREFAAGEYAAALMKGSKPHRRGDGGHREEALGFHRV